MNDHLLDLGDEWGLWKQFILRGSGFPFALLESLARPSLYRDMEAQLVDAEAQLERATHEARQACNAAARASQDPSIAKAWRTLSDRLYRGKQVTAPPTPDTAVETCLATLSVCRERVTELHATAETTYRESRIEISAQLKKIAAEDHFREAIAWQNRSLLSAAIDPFLQTAPDRRDARHRARERLVVSYLQRYCAKNDSIGFFGPVAWGTISDSGPTLQIESSMPVAETGTVHLEYWAVETIAKKIAELPGMRNHLAPRLLPYFCLTDNTLETPMGTMHRSKLELAVLRHCDGTQSASAIAARLARESEHDATSVIAALAQLREHGLVTWEFCLPRVGNRFEDSLEKQIEAVDDVALKSKAHSQLEPFLRARAALQAARGSAEAVNKTMAELETAFSELCGTDSTRLGGEIYSARTLTYLDCQRATELSFGPKLRDALAPVLKLLGQSARWLGVEVARATHADLLSLFRQLVQDKGELAAPQFWMAATALFPRAGGNRSSAVQAVFDEYVARWAQILDLTGSDIPVVRQSRDLERATSNLFAASTIGWPSARTCSPDLMIAARSIDAIKKGDFQCVMGELHYHSNTLELHALLEMNPRRDEVLEGAALDFAAGRVAHTPPADTAGRAFLTPLTDLPEDVQIEYEDTPSSRPPEKTARVGDLLIYEEDNELFVKSRVSERSWPVLSFVDQLLSEFNPEIVVASAHTPRITIDEVVVVRETWRFQVCELHFAKPKNPLACFREVNRWARSHQIPRRTFYRASNEPKPCYLDLDSPLLVELFAHSLGKSKTVTLSEMLPTPEECWLSDSQGSIYTAEIRTAIVDPLSWSA